MHLNITIIRKENYIPLIKIFLEKILKNIPIQDSKKYFDIIYIIIKYSDEIRFAYYKNWQKDRIEISK